MKKTSVAAISAIFTIFFITAVTILADLLPSLKNWLKASFSHHWIGKGFLAAILFLLLMGLFSKIQRQPENGTTGGYLRFVSYFAIACVIILFGFFAFEAYGR